jgi:hypothetical protein
MELKIVKKQQCPLRIALYGRSGSGVTYSALQLAYGLCGDWSCIALIDSSGQSNYYARLGAFNTLQIGPPFHPARYYEALDLCIESGVGVVIIDSLSHEWQGPGGVLDTRSDPDYAQVLQEHRCLLSLISQARVHVICTMQSTGVLISSEGTSGGLPRLLETPVQQDGIEHPFTVVLRLDSNHQAHVIKDSTGVLPSHRQALLESDHGAFLRKWADQGEPALPETLQAKIDACRSVQELHRLIAREDLEDMALISAFTRRRLELEGHSPKDAA